MKCICRVKSFATPIGAPRHRMYSPGQVDEFEKCPTHFNPLSKAKVDFLTASKEELTSVKWKFEDAYAAVIEAYEVELFREDGTKKSEIVAQILDARERATDKSIGVPKAQ